ncbi:MAG: hypothetical protein ACI9BD_000632 [Candidatus Marinamargulisbacteria bacterium]|jgi:hypothetical protein
MRSRCLFGWVVLGLLCLGSPVVPASLGGGVAVVELFTSEGCSSCPPADKLFSTLVKKQQENVFLLGFHVDYWDYLGWTDENSDRQYTRRQRAYGRAFNLKSVYTPQIVVNGKSHMVGSKKSAVLGAISDQLAKPAKFRLTLRLTQEPGKKDGFFTVRYKVYPFRAGMRLNIAMVERSIRKKIRGGENSGLELRHNNVVRQFVQVPVSKPTGWAKIKVPEKWRKKRLSLIGYLQDKESFEILSADRVNQSALKRRLRSL